MKRVLFTLTLVLSMVMLSTTPFDSNTAKAVTSDTSELNMTYLKENLKPGLTKEQVKKKLGTTYEVYNEPMNNQETWKYKIGKIKDYQFSGLPDEIDTDGIKSGKLKIEVAIIFKENAVDYISIHYLSNDEIQNYFMDSSGYIKDRSADTDKGDKLPIVKEYQKKLIALGYKLSRYGADGHFGSETEEAVKQFQRNHRLSVNGIIGDETARKIENALAANSHTYSGTIFMVKKPYIRGEHVKEIQKVVGVVQDGIYGSKTEKAVWNLQYKSGVVTDGIVGPITWAILFDVN